MLDLALSRGTGLWGGIAKSKLSPSSTARSREFQITSDRSVPTRAQDNTLRAHVYSRHERSDEISGLMMGSDFESDASTLARLQPKRN